MLCRGNDSLKKHEKELQKAGLRRILFFDASLLILPRFARLFDTDRCNSLKRFPLLRGVYYFKKLRTEFVEKPADAGLFLQIISFIKGKVFASE